MCVCVCELRQINPVHCFRWDFFPGCERLEAGDLGGEESELDDNDNDDDDAVDGGNGTFRG